MARGLKISTGVCCFCHYTEHHSGEEIAHPLATRRERGGKEGRGQGGKERGRKKGTKGEVGEERREEAGGEEKRDHKQNTFFTGKQAQ